MEALVEQLEATGGIVDPVDVLVGIVVEIMVFEQDVATGYDADVPVAEATDVGASAVVGCHRELLSYVQLHAVVAVYKAIKKDGAAVIGDFEAE